MTKIRRDVFVKAVYWPGLLDTGTGGGPPFFSRLKHGSPIVIALLYSEVKSLLIFGFSPILSIIFSYSPGVLRQATNNFRAAVLLYVKYPRHTALENLTWKTKMINWCNGNSIHYHGEWAGEYSDTPQWAGEYSDTPHPPPISIFRNPFRPLDSNFKRHAQIVRL